MTTESNGHADSANAQPGADTPVTAHAKPPRKRRWRRRLLLAFGGLVVLLAILLIAAPTIVSSKGISDYALARVSGSLQGDIQAGGLSVSWFGPILINDASVRDAAQRDVLRAKRLSVDAGLWQLLTGDLALGNVRIDDPEVLVYFDEHNNVSIADAFQPAKRTEPSPAPPAAASADKEGGLPEIQGRVVITNGTIRFERDGHGTYAVTALAADVDVKSLNDITGELDMTLDDDTRLAAGVEMTDLASAGTIDVRKASGSINIATDRETDLSSLLAVLAQQDDISGRARLDVTVAVQPGDLSADLAIEVADLHNALSGDAPALDARLAGKLALRDDALTADLDLTGTPGAISAALSADLPDALPEINAERLTAALLAGDPINLPGFELVADSNIDLVALDRALPGMLPLREGQQLTGGTARIASLRINGGDTPSVSAQLQLNGVAARDATRTTNLQPITLDLDAHIEPTAGLCVAKANLASSFAHVRASGSVSHLTAEFDSDLSAARRDLAQIVDLGELEFGGQMTGALSLKRTDERNIDTNLRIDATGAHFASGDKVFDLARASISQAGRLATDGHALKRVEADTLSADLNGEIVASGAGYYDLSSGALDARLDVARADLGFAASRANALGAPELARYAGNLTGNLTAKRETAAGAFQTDGQLTASQLAADGRPLLDQDATIAWSDIQLPAANQPIRAGQLNLNAGATATANLRDIELDTATSTVTRGTINATADLERLLRTVGIVAQMDEPPAIKGQFTIDSNVVGEAGGYHLVGGGNVAGLEIGSGEQTIREDRLDLALDAQFDPKARRITLGKNQVTSRPLTAVVTGTIDKYDSDLIADLSGNYDASWPTITALLHELAPGTVDLVALEGQSKSEFTIKGPLNTADAKPAFRDAKARVAFGWDRAQLVGIDLGPARFQPVLADGNLALPGTGVSAAQGNINLGGQFDFRPDDMTLRMPGNVQLLQDIKLTPALTQQLLGRINPIFHNLAAAEGVINLRLQDIVFPLGESAKHLANGRGRLDMLEVRIMPAGLLRELLALGGVAQANTPIAVRISGLNIDVREGRIHYKDFQLNFPKDFELRFYGSVGLDDTLDLVVSIPIRPALLQRLGVRGPVEEYASVLETTRIDIPLVGTRQQPRLDFSRVDTKALVEQAVKATAGKTLEQGLGNLLGQKQDDASNGEKKDDDKARDALQGLFKNLQDQQKKKKKRK